MQVFPHHIAFAGRVDRPVTFPGRAAFLVLIDNVGWGVIVHIVIPTKLYVFFAHRADRDASDGKIKLPRFAGFCMVVRPGALRFVGIPCCRSAITYLHHTSHKKEVLTERYIPARHLPTAIQKLATRLTLLQAAADEDSP